STTSPSRHTRPGRRGKAGARPSATASTTSSAWRPAVSRSGWSRSCGRRDLLDQLLGEVLGLDDLGQEFLRIDLRQGQPRGDDGLRIAGLDAGEATVGLKLPGPGRLGLFGEQPVDEDAGGAGMGGPV